MAEPPSPPPSPSSESRPGGAWGAALAYINESTKFIVSAAALYVLVAYPNVQTCWCILGSVVNSINGKIMKQIVNQTRPEGATKADPGMPSSHAVSLTYSYIFSYVRRASRRSHMASTDQPHPIIQPHPPLYQVSLSYLSVYSAAALVTNSAAFGVKG